MKEYLLIRNFGPIDEVILDDIRPLTVFIGESGSGKSTIMKVLSLFRWMYKRVNLRSYLQQAGIKKTGVKFKIKSLLKVSGMIPRLATEAFFIVIPPPIMADIPMKLPTSIMSGRVVWLVPERLCTPSIVSRLEATPFIFAPMQISILQSCCM